MRTGWSCSQTRTFRRILGGARRVPGSAHPHPVVIQQVADGAAQGPEGTTPSPSGSTSSRSPGRPVSQAGLLAHPRGPGGTLAPRILAFPGDCGQPGGSRTAPAEPGRTPRGDAGHGHVQAAPGVQDQRCEPHITDTHGPCSVRHRAREGPRASASVQGLPRAARGQADAGGWTEGCTDGHGDDDRWSLEPGRSRVQEFGEARRRGRYPRCPRELLSKRSKTRLKIFVPPQDADQTVSAVASCFRSRGH
ncbi:fibril-forming collagen alpha chain-like [Canis lupus familiaris]|uniref:fibril-forming collagen alpha chain-like n=1 Tax=Canis lupus familiaris TaxID=9615 RepID=UPI0018F4DA8F|nr:fibril-forming collagen alpha chain-like [Canis lupus familiaris]